MAISIPWSMTVKQLIETIQDKNLEDETSQVFSHQGQIIRGKSIEILICNNNLFSIQGSGSQTGKEYTGEKIIELLETSISFF